MQKDDPKTTFIVTTASAHGAWYPEKKAALSLINSHVANRKAQQINQRRGQPDAVSRRAKSRRRTSPSPQIPSTDALDNIESEQAETTGADVSVQSSWTFEELYDLFGDQGTGTQGSAEATEASSSAYKLKTNNPTQSKTESQAQFLPGGGSSLGSGKNPVQELGSRLPHRVEVLSLDGRHNRESSASKPVTRLPNQFVDISTIFKQIDTILDPFLQLAVKITFHEQHLLHFYLTEGRQILFGTSAVPAYCPALHAVQRGMLKRSPAYVETHIAMAEHILCVLRHTKVSANFFRRRADAYKTVGDLILNGHAEFDDQLCGLVTLQMAEFTMGRDDLQLVHLKAMHQLVQRHGGMKSFLDQRDPDNALIEPMFYANQFILTKFEQDQDLELPHGVKQDFIQNLAQIERWTLKVQGLANDSPSETLLTPHHRSSYKRESNKLITYLRMVTTRFLRNRDTPYHQAAGIFHLLFNLCMTLVIMESTASSTSRFLVSLQLAMDQSLRSNYEKVIDENKEHSGRPDELHTSVIVSLVSQLRRKIRSAPAQAQHSTLHEREVNLSEASINALKTFSALDYGTRLRVSRGLLRSILAICDITIAEGFGELELEDLTFELSRQPP